VKFKMVEIKERSRGFGEMKSLKRASKSSLFGYPC